MRGVKSRLSILFILLTTFLDSSSSFSAKILPDNFANYTDDSRGGICELCTSCTCVNNRRGTYVHCPGIVDIRVEYYSSGKNVYLQCYPQSSVDPFEYLSIVDFEPDNENRDRTGVTVTDCPAPEHSYSSYFKTKGEGKYYSSYTTIWIDMLNVHCDSIKSFSLESHHFDGLTHLEVLEIQCRVLEKIPQDLLKGVSEKLLSLRIADTSIEYIPHNLISKFPVLSCVILENNKLKSLPEDIFLESTLLENLNPVTTEKHLSSQGGLQWIEAIEFLDVGGNRLGKLPKSWCILVKLNFLRVSNNLLEYIEPELFTHLHSLEHLYIGGNRIRTLESGLMIGKKCINDFQLSTSSTVSQNSIRINSMSKLPKDVFRSNLKLSTLDISYNNLKTLPENTFFSKIGLEKINLSSNLLINLTPNVFERNINLVTLDLSNNSLSYLPEGFLSNLGNLKYLYLSKNKIRRLGNFFFSGVKSLRRVDLSYNLIEVLDDELFSPFNQSTSFKFLNLERNQLTILPIFTIPSLTYLNLAGNNLTTFKMESFQKVLVLDYLNLSYNNIQFVESMTRPGRKYIKSFDLSHNRLNMSLDLNNPLQKLSLVEFYISGNVINSFKTDIISTHELFFLFYMEYLDMSNNSMLLFDIGISRGILPKRRVYNIQYMDLSNNKLNFNNTMAEYDYTMITWGYKSQLYQFGNLEVLLLHHNEIDVIPMDWRHSLPKLRLLDLRYNKIKYLGHQDLLFANGITPPLLKKLGHPENIYIKKTHPETYYQFSNAHKLTVDLRHNLVEGMELSYDKMMDVARGCFVDDEFGHATILLGHNPFICGCNVFTLLRYALKELRPVADWEREEGHRLMMPAAIDIDGLACWEPLSVRGKNVSDPESWIHHLLPALALCHSSHYFKRNYQTVSNDYHQDIP